MKEWNIYFIIYITYKFQAYNFLSKWLQLTKLSASGAKYRVFVVSTKVWLVFYLCQFHAIYNTVWLQTVFNISKSDQCLIKRISKGIRYLE